MIQPSIKSLHIGFIILFLGLNTAAAQTFIYYVDFFGTGETNTIDSIKVHNISKDETYTMTGTDTLVLWDGYVAYPETESRQNGLFVYPNPTLNEAEVKLITNVKDNFTILLCDISGKILSRYESQVESGIESFRLKGLGNGVYIIHYINQHEIYSAKIISKGLGTKPILIPLQSDWNKLQPKSSHGRSFFHVHCEIGDLFHFTAYGNEHAVVTPFYAEQSASIMVNFQSCIDADLNSYPIVYIGEQVWMAENLRITKYADGSPIPNVTNGSTWINLITGAYCWYNNDAAFRHDYGALYNWYALNELTNGGKNPCPVGWHPATDEEWTILGNFVGGFPATGGRLKQTGFTHWQSPNTGATNERAFSALPGGSRTWNGSFDRMGTYGYYWTATEQQGSFAWLRNLFHNAANFGRGSINKHNGFSVRCVKD
jgi:uncharacterized protein (TIGR02145 family)